MFKEEIANSVSKMVHWQSSDVFALLEVPPDAKLGDYALPCFGFARELKKAPHVIAQDLAKEWHREGVRAESNGAYLNFFVDRDALARHVLPEVFQRGIMYGHFARGDQRIVVEFPGPNTNKPLHLGHVRNMVLGESTCRILEAAGQKVTRVDIVNDRGIHICKSMLAYGKWGNGRLPDKKSDHFVGDFYVLYSQHEKEHPEIAEEAALLLRKWEEGDSKVRALWKKMNDWALLGFRETYALFGVSHEKAYFESEIYEEGKAIVLDGLARGIFEKDEKGNIVAALSKFKLPDKVVLRSDGTSVYVTQDIALAHKRMEDFNFTKAVYIVGSEQNLHFQQLFAILQLLGFKQAQSCYHLSYGMVFLPEGKMKSREGTVVDADDLVEEMKSHAREEIMKRHDIDEEELVERSSSIGLGGLKFFILKYDPQKDFIFNPKESISFEGETGPYVQYAHARICSILSKAEEKIHASADFSLLKEEQEKEIVKLLMEYPDTILEAAKAYKPSIIARFALELAQAVNNYYHAVPVLKSEEHIRAARLLLLHCTRTVLASSLNLLGIDAVEEM